MKRLWVILGLLIIVKHTFGQNAVCSGIDIIFSDSLVKEQKQKRIIMLSDTTKSALKMIVTDGSDNRGKNSDRTIPFVQIKIISAKNDTIKKQTDFDGECLIQLAEGIYKLEFSYYINKYEDTIELKNAFYYKLNLDFDFFGNKKISLTKTSLEYSKIDFSKE